MPQSALTGDARSDDTPPILHWIAAEATPVRTLRAHALSTWHVDRTDLLARAYWKHGSTSTDNDAAGLIAYQRAMADGADLHDPELAESIDLAL
ncbi:siderophore-interacting protein [Nocardia sp. CA2R105]|uniref:SIP domain-containing protein n=1 Tax=Nocardia coffeae TaxID=2873381 RepID=UPI001CA71290|nr:SIP domain-containing protein [Nocardia coffeae]MBY8855001.1 siderophore-interacting protein [Nocardia coffeae]